MANYPRLTKLDGGVLLAKIPTPYKNMVKGKKDHAGCSKSNLSKEILA